MPYGLIDDKAHRHPKREHVALTVDGLLFRAISYCAEHLTDGFVPETFVRDHIDKHCAALELPPRRARAETLMIRAMMTRPLPPRDNPVFHEVEHGYLVHDYLEVNRSRAEIGQGRGRDRRKKALARDTELRAAIRTRDADTCRYCDRSVDFRDRRGAEGGTYDHLDPNGENSLANIVVACRSCNSVKRDSTPEQAGMPLLPARGTQMSLGKTSTEARNGLENGLETDLTRSRSFSGLRAFGFGEEQKTENGDRSESHATALPTELAVQVSGIVAVFAAFGLFIDEASAANALARFPKLTDPLATARGAAEACRANPGKPTGLTLHRWFEKQVEADGRRSPAAAGAARDFSRFDRAMRS